MSVCAGTFRIGMQSIDFRDAMAVLWLVLNLGEDSDSTPPSAVSTSMPIDRYLRFLVRAN
jgi:hypothetical protein